jgi:cardiolipin synthase
MSQILLVLAVIFSQGISALPPAWLDTLVYVVLATTVLSGIDYVWTWGWRAWNRKRGSGRFP